MTPGIFRQLRLGSMILLAVMSASSSMARVGPAAFKNDLPGGAPQHPHLVAATHTYQFFNPFPFPIQIKVYGKASLGFPKVYTVPGGPIAIPYPELQMTFRVKSGGGWSKKISIPWRPGPTSFQSVLD